jgi:hypothetical protein
MEVSGQLHAPAALPLLGKQSRCTLDRKLGGHQSQPGYRREEKNLTLLGTEPRLCSPYATAILTLWMYETSNLLSQCHSSGSQMPVPHHTGMGLIPG